MKLTRELWKRQIWTDARAVEIMKEASLSENEKVIIGGVRFFLGGDKEREEAADEDSDDDDGIDVAKLKHQIGINKKTKKKAGELKKAAASVKRVRSISSRIEHGLTACRKNARRMRHTRSTSLHCICCTTRKGLRKRFSLGTSKTKSPNLISSRSCSFSTSSPA